MKAITANRLIDGEVVFWNEGAWVERFGQAQLFDDDAIADETAARAQQPLKVVDAYLIDVVEEEGGFAPISYRERIRALGPQNHPHHGKQAEGGPDIDVIKQAHGVARSGGRFNLIKLKK